MLPMVYVIMETNRTSQHIHSIWKTKDKAEAHIAAKKSVKHSSHSYLEYEILEYVLED